MISLMFAQNVEMTLGTSVEMTLGTSGGDQCKEPLGVITGSCGCISGWGQWVGSVDVLTGCDHWEVGIHFHAII